MLTRFLDRFLHLQLDKRAVTSLEYAMIAMLVAVASVGAVNSTGTHVSTTFTQVSSEL